MAKAAVTKNLPAKAAAISCGLPSAHMEAPMQHTPPTRHDMAVDVRRPHARFSTITAAARLDGSSRRELKKADSYTEPPRPPTDSERP